MLGIISMALFSHLYAIVEILVCLKVHSLLDTLANEQGLDLLLFSLMPAHF